jgi:hypothetical protein
MNDDRDGRRHFSIWSHAAVMENYSDLKKLRDDLGRSTALMYWLKANGSTSRNNANEHFQNILPAYLKSAIPSHTADPAAVAQVLTDQFGQLVKRAELIGRLGLVSVPPLTWTPMVTTTGSASFTAEGQPFPAILFDRVLSFLQPKKIGLVAAFTREFLRSTDERSAAVLFQKLRAVIINGLDEAFLSDAAAVAGDNPAGILAGISAAGAGSPSSADDDARALLDAVCDGDPQDPAFVCNRRGAMYLRGLSDANHGSLFRDVSAGADVGSVAGIPQFVCRAAGARLILIDRALIGVADEGLELDQSSVASVHLDNAPTVGAASMTSAMQTNTQIIRAIRNIDWVRAADDAVSYITLPIGSPS